MPLSDVELEELARHETERSELKETLADREKIKRAICAFANDLADHRAPGVVLVGLRADGSCAGLKINDELERMAASFRSDGSLLPIPSMLVRRRRLRNCDVLVIEVEPASAPPVRLSGTVWVRVGTTNQKATREEEQKLAERVRWHALSFDLRPVADATLDVLDLVSFRDEYLPSAVSREVLAVNERSLPLQLASLRMTTSEGTPTYAGILVLGKDPRRWIPGAYVQFLRVDGLELTDPIIDEKQIDGTLAEVIRRIDEILTINIRTAVVIAGAGTEQRHPDYPIEALRQLVRNAVMHRAYEGTNAPVRIYWFNDRVEIHSPGGPFGRVSRENFGQPGVTDYRNPHLAEAMKVLGYVQQFGYGIPLARKELALNGNPPPEFSPESAHVLAVVRRRP